MIQKSQMELVEVVITKAKPFGGIIEVGEE